MMTRLAGHPGDEDGGRPAEPSRDDRRGTRAEPSVDEGRRVDRAGDEGSGTVLALALVFLLLAALATLSLVGQAAVARQRAATAADLVALAVAADLAADLPPGSCPARSWAVAVQVARSMTAAPVSCQVLTDGSVLVQVTAAGPGLWAAGVNEWARAGGGEPTPVPRANPP